MRRVTAKLGRMRKAQTFTIYPQDGSGMVIVQSHKAIGRFDHTGKGILNAKGSSEKYFHHLSKALGAEDFQFPTEFVIACIENQPRSGDEIAHGVFVK